MNTKNQCVPQDSELDCCVCPVMGGWRKFAGDIE